MFDNKPNETRIETAKLRTSRLVDHLMYLMELHENNAIVLYSDTLAAQIPTSFAANAFKVFQGALHQFELVRLCALWDKPDFDKENIATIIELIDTPDIIEALVQETRAAHLQGNPILMNPSPDPELNAIEVHSLQVAEHEFASGQAERVRVDLTKAIADARAIHGSSKLQSIMNLRDKHLAHSLSETRLEKKVGVVAPMRYGDERNILEATIPIVEVLYRGVNGKGFSIADSKEIDRQNAQALWSRCTFNIEH
jgi:hypothetical protein